MFDNIDGKKKRKYWLRAFSPIPKMFSTLPRTNYKCQVRSNLLSAKALDFSKKVFSHVFQSFLPPGWLSGERVGLMTWWLRVRSPVEETFLSGVFSPLTSAEACGKSSRWLWKEKLCSYWCEKARKQICVTDRHDMTLAVKVALNPNTTNQPTNQSFLYIEAFDSIKASD